MATPLKSFVAAAYSLHVFGVLFVVASAQGEMRARPPSTDAESRADAGSATVWRAERLCAANSLYFVLRFCDKTPKYQELQDALLHETHASLYDIKNAAAKYALDLRIVRLTPEELRRAQLPVIAHFEIVAVDGRVGGHFVVVTRAGNDSVEYFDGSTGEPFELSWREFERQWSGFAAVNAERWGTRLFRLAAYFAVSLSVTLLAVRVVRRFYRDSPIPSSQLKQPSNAAESR